jgi:hypothetical protein
LPGQVVANQFPDFILDVQLVAIFEEREGGEVLVEVEEFAELVEDVGIGQEIAAVFGAVFLEGRLDFLEHVAEFLFNLSTHYRCMLAVEAINNMGNMLIIFGAFHLS